MTKKETINISINSEIGKLNGVILHTPGVEVRNMIPENIEKALYSDILNVDIARTEYSQLSGVLDCVTNTFQVKTLLNDILEDIQVRKSIIDCVCKLESLEQKRNILEELDANGLANGLLEGILRPQNSLTDYINYKNDNRYILDPLHNFFFTRDASISVNDKVLIGKMANKIRERESLIMKYIFDNHRIFKTSTVSPTENDMLQYSDIKIEGGDVLIAREDVLVIGLGCRTNSQGIDFIVDKLAKQKANMDIVVQQLPFEPESFIHLDMVFTFLDTDKCMVYEPLILSKNNYQTFNIKIINGDVKIKEKENLLIALNELGFDLQPLSCGGSKEVWNQKREQWHSGANFFAFAPGKVIGYERNMNTIEELNNHGFEVLKANDIITGKVSPENYKNCVVTIEGSELPRGGGGARCMTMPISRNEVKW